MIPSVDAQLAADSSSRTSEFHNAVRVAGHPVRVCILTETYRPIVGGGEKQAQSLAEDLVRQGLPTTVVTRQTDQALATQEMMNGVSIVRIPPVGRTRAARWLMLWPARARVFLAPKTRRVDVTIAKSRLVRHVAGYPARTFPSLTAASVRNCGIGADRELGAA